MKLPKGAGPVEDDIKIEGDKNILNPCFEKQFLTKQEALNTINVLSGMLLIDEVRKC